MTKTLSLLAILCLALPIAANAEVTIDEASNAVHAKFSGQLISCNGSYSSEYIVVSLPDGTLLEVQSESVVQVANNLCDLKAPWSAGHPLALFCIAK